MIWIYIILCFIAYYRMEKANTPTEVFILLCVAWLLLYVISVASGFEEYAINEIKIHEHGYWQKD